MKLFSTLKQKLNIGGVKLQLNVNPHVQKETGEIKGSITVTAKSDQQVEKLNFKLVEEYSTGRSQEKQTREYELGSSSYEIPFDIKIGETKTMDFILPFELLKSGNQNLQEMGGVFKAVGKMGSFVDNEKSEYIVKVDANVKGVMMGPSDSANVRLV